MLGGLDTSYQPTREELHNGPGKAALPESLQGAEVGETECKYCGVSYLVFSEMQEMKREAAYATAKMESWKGKIESIKEMEAALKAAKERATELERSQAEMAARTKELEARLKRDKEDWELERRQIESKAALDKQEAVDRVTKEFNDRMEAVRTEMELKVTHESMGATRAQHKLDSMVSAVTNLKRGTQRARSCVDILRTHVEAEMYEFVDALTDATSQLSSRAGAAERTAARLRKRVAEAESSGTTAVASTRREIGELKELLTQLERDREEETAQLRRQLETCEAQWKAASDRVAAECDKRLEVLNAQLSDVKTALGAERQAHTSAAMRERELRLQVTDLMKSSAAMRERLDASEKANSDAKALEAALADQAKKHEAAIGKLRQELEAHAQAAAAQLEARAHEVAELRRQLEAADTGSAELKRAHDLEMRDLYEQLQASKSEAAMATDKCRRLEADLSNMAGSADRGKQVMEEQMRELQQQLETTVLELAAQRGEVDKYRSLAERAQRQAEEADKLAASSKGLEDLERHLIKLTEQVRQKDQEIVHLEATVQAECTERTYILDQLNHLREQSSMRPLRLDEVRAAAAASLTMSAAAQTATMMDSGMYAATYGGGGGGGGARAGTVMAAPAPAAPPGPVPMGPIPQASARSVGSSGSGRGRPAPGARRGGLGGKRGRPRPGGNGGWR